MPSLFVIRHFTTTGAKARQTVIDALAKVAEQAILESGVLKFCVGVPRKGDEDSVFTIEEYADQAAKNAHHEHVSETTDILAKDTDTSLFASPPIVFALPSAVSFTRASVAQTADPFVILANFGYQPNTTVSAVAGWRDLVASAEASEGDTLSYTVLADEEAGFIRTVEAYASQELLYGVHVKSDAIAANQQQNGDWRTGAKEVHRLKIVAGFLYKARSV
ncbi:hypothetical protein P7C73_g6670, partial [Tremellales sp. Uapishka_1]